MRNKKYIVIGILCIAVILLAGNIPNIVGRVRGKEIKTIRVMLGVPGEGMREEQLENKSDVESMVKYLNRIDKKYPVYRGKVKGWEVAMQCFDENEKWLYTISFAGPYMSVNDRWYYVGEKETEKMKEKFEDLWKYA